MIGDIYGQFKKSEEGRRTAHKTDSVEGWWENLGPDPIYIRDKYHLKKVCEDIEKKTGRQLIPKMFMKPRSQGNGVEWSF